MFTEVPMASKNAARDLASSEKLQLSFGIRERVVECAMPTILSLPRFTLQQMHHPVNTSRMQLSITNQ